MAMTNLQLCNKLIQKCAISGGSIATIANQTGEMARVIAWIDEAYQAIQRIHSNWDWMRRDVSFTTTAGKSKYTPAECGASDVATWKMDSFRTYITSVGVASEVFLGELEYDRYRDTYLYGNMRNTTGRPIAIAVTPGDLSLNLGLTPDSIGYTVVGQYFHEPLTFTADGDVPTFPSKYHMIIVYRAMMYYGSYEAAGDVYNEGLNAYNELVRKLNNEQLQDVTLGSAFV